MGPFLQGRRHDVAAALSDTSGWFRLVHGFVQYREAGRADQAEEPAYLLDQDCFMTQQLEWAGVFSTLNRVEQETGQFFQLCVTDQFHQAMGPKAA